MILNLIFLSEYLKFPIFISLPSFEPSTRAEGYVFTQFETDLGRYNHYFRIK